MVIPGRILYLKAIEKENLVPYSTVEPPVLSSSYQSSQQVGNNNFNSRKSNSCLKKCISKREYIPYESNFENFKEIEVSPTMGWEHFPHQYDNVLDDIYDSWKTGPHAPSSFNKSF